jgi:hypothetical protein
MQETGMRRLWIAGIALTSMLTFGAAMAATKLTPAEIQATFFNGVEFVSATPSGVKYKMIFTADGKMVRVPAGGGGTKSEGSWKLDESGYCTTWKNSKPSCYTVVAAEKNKWSVMKGPAVFATWSK